MSARRYGAGYEPGATTAASSSATATACSKGANAKVDAALKKLRDGYYSNRKR